MNLFDLFKDLTRPVITDPNSGKNIVAKDDAQAAKVLAGLSAKTAQPSSASVDGTIGAPSFTLSGLNFADRIPEANTADFAVNPGQDSTSGVSFNPPQPQQQPTVTTPSFLDAASKNPPALTRKGTILAGLIRGGIDAALGAAAGAGSYSMGEGFQRGAKMQRDRLMLPLEAQAAQQEAQLRQAQIANQPLTLAGLKAGIEASTAHTNFLKKQTEMLGSKPDRAPSETELALAASDPSNPERAAMATAALDRLWKGKHADAGEPKSYDQLVLASELESDPTKKGQYDAAIGRIERFRQRPTKDETQADYDRKLKRDVNIVAAQALAANNNDDVKAVGLLTRQLSNGNNLSQHEREVAAGAIMALRHRTDPLADAVSSALKQALDKKNNPTE